MSSTQTKLYYIRGIEIRSVDVVRETKIYYYLAEYLAEFGFYERTPKCEACLTPLEAITRAIATRESITGYLQKQIEVEENYLAELKRVYYELNSNSNSPESNHASEVAP